MSDNTVEGGDGSKYRGMKKRKWGKYVCEIRLSNSRERIWLGSHDTAEKATRAFDAALFYLRGCAAKFNFPNDLPDILGGEPLSLPEIQAVAQQYANSFGGGPSSGLWAGPGGGEHEFWAREGPVDLVDQSFWEMEDVSGGHNAGCIADFGLYSEPEPVEMYMDPHYVSRVYEDEDECYDHGGLRNF